jgi:hypothetical protein
MKLKRPMMVIAATIGLGALGVFVDSTITNTTATASGTWAQATAVTAPFNASANPPFFLGTGFDGISCWSAGNCTAVGTYPDSSNVGQAMAATATSRTWAQATEVTAPSDFGTNGVAILRGISCSSAGNCAAVGDYAINNFGATTHAMVTTETSGNWAQATKLTLPSNANTTSGTLRGVSCWSPGNCTAVGYYADSSNVGRVMAATETSGIWAPATEVMLPSDANTTNPTNPIETLAGISCSSAGNCTASGQYTDSSGAVRPMAATETSGTWAQATPLTSPPNAGSGTFPSGGGFLTAISCWSAGNCTTVGTYIATGGQSQLMAATQTSGAWAQATQLPLPSNSNGGLPTPQAISCSSAGNCTASGQYPAPSGNQAMALTETSGTWEAAQITLPSNAANSFGQNASLGGVSCTTAGNCTGAGNYIDTSGHSHAMVADESSVTASPTTTTVSSSSNPSTAGSPVSFTANVSSTGGTPTGSVQFTVDGTNLGDPVQLSGGTAASQPTSSLPTGSHTVTASYLGASGFGVSSASVTQVVTNTTCPTLAGCNLQGLNLKYADLTGDNLSGANLTGADLSGAKLNGADLSSTNLSGVDLSGANLSGADLSDANSKGTDLTGAILNGANLTGINLNGANLTNADLEGATTTGANFNKVTWSNTTCSDGTNSNSDGGTCLGHL